MVVLKLDKHNDKKEIEFELDYLRSLTTAERFQMMLQKTQEMLSLLKRNEHRKTAEKAISAANPIMNERG